MAKKGEVFWKAVTMVRRVLSAVRGVFRRMVGCVLS